MSSQVTRATFDKLTSQTLPPPGRLAEVLAGLPPGTNRMLVSLYTPLDLDELLVDDAVVLAERQDVPPGGTVSVRARLAGTLPPGEVREVIVVPQPLVHPDVVLLRVRERHA